jgi:hypothetical protein
MRKKYDEIFAMFSGCLIELSEPVSQVRICFWMVLHVPSQQNALSAYPDITK